MNIRLYNARIMTMEPPGVIAEGEIWVSGNVITYVGEKKESEEELTIQSKALKEEFKSLKKQNGKDYFDNCHEQYRFKGKITVNRLNPATQYYYRAWAIKNRKLYLGDIKTFETPDLPPISGTHEGHDYVDLGLPSGLKWATCNIGASAPEEYGDFFAYGYGQGTRRAYSEAY